MTYENIVKVLEKYNQKQILAFYDKLTEQKQDALLNQISSIDFDLMDKLYNNAINGKKEKKDKITPMDVIDREKLSDKEKEQAMFIGEECIRNGGLAYVTMAGGQGTRLGHAGPKGTYILDIENNKSLFELLCDTLKAAKDKYNVIIPWYIMTSRENNDDTIKFFEENAYFNYGKDNVHFFIQGELPMILEDGQFVMESPYKIKEAADGHGGIFNAMTKNNIVEDMKQKGIKWVFISGVDNCLVKMVDPLLIGLSENNNVKIASKTIVKAYPEEKVGVFCKRNGRPSVIEYTEIPDEMMYLKNDIGELAYGESHILFNMFRIDLLDALGKKPLQYHSAHKATSYIDSMENLVKTDKPNAYKFEAFIFDAFSIEEEMLLLRIKREEEFAPVKNKEGVDSPETARKLLMEARR